MIKFKKKKLFSAVLASIIHIRLNNHVSIQNKSLLIILNILLLYLEIFLKT